MIRDKVYIPTKKFLSLTISEKTYIKSLLSKNIVNPYLCNLVAVGRYCKKALDKNNNVNRQACFKCPMSNRNIKCYKLTKKYFIFPKGNKSIVNEILNICNLQLQDCSIYERLDESLTLKFNFDLAEKDTRFNHQKELVSKFINLGFGQIKAPPRSGKTVIGALVTTELNTRTAIIIHQKELLDQFYNTFLSFTNIEELSRMHSKRLIAINPKPHEINDIIIGLFTWQQFRSKTGKDKLKEYRKLFGLVIADECHRCSSDVYYSILSVFWAKYYLGLSATPTRKDGLHIRSELLFGPPLIEGGSEQLDCNFYVLNTGWFKSEYKNMNSRTWNYLWTSLANNLERNQLIVNYSVKAIEKGHKVIIPVTRIAQAKNIINLIPNKYKKIMFVSKIKDRDIETDKIRKGYYDIVVATKRLIAEGFDCPPMSMLILNAGSYHSDVNNLYQEYSRVRTKYKNKKKPVLIILNDDFAISNNSTKKIVKELKSKGFKDKGVIC